MPMFNPPKKMGELTPFFAPKMEGPGNDFRVVQLVNESMFKSDQNFSDQ